MKFTPGTSGNPGGRPKRDKFITQRLIAELTDIDPATEAPRLHKVVRALVQKAEEGDVVAAREIMDRVEGKVLQVNENHNYSDIARLSDDEIARLLTGRILDEGPVQGVPAKTNGSGKAH